VLLQVVGEIGPEVFDIKLGLAHRVEAGNQFIQPGPPDDEYDLVLCKPFHDMLLALFLALPAGMIRPADGPVPP
jgi:hypothetical protein